MIVLLAALAGTPACDSLIGLGEPPASASGSTGVSSGASTSSAGGDTSSAGGSDTTSISSGGGAGGDGGGGAATTSSAGGNGGQGGTSPSGFLAGCGSCEEPSEECPVCSEDGRCLQRQWSIPDTARVVEETDPGGILNRYSRAVAVTPDAIVFTRNRVGPLEEGGIPKLFLTLVRFGGGPHVDLAIPDSSGGGIGVVAATPSGRIFATTLTETTPLSELIDGSPPTLVPGRTLDGAYAINHLIASGRGDELILAQRTTSNLFRFEPDEEVEPPCALGVSASPAYEPADLAVTDGRVSVLQYTSGRVQNALVDGPCNGGELELSAASPGDGISYGHAVAGVEDPLWVVGRESGRAVLVRVDVPEAPRLAVYSSAALDMHGPDLYVAGPLGGVFRCPSDAPGIESYDVCTQLVGAEAGLVSLIHAGESTVITVGYLENGELVSDTRVVCRDLN